MIPRRCLAEQKKPQYALDNIRDQGDLTVQFGSCRTFVDIMKSISTIETAWVTHRNERKALKEQEANDQPEAALEEEEDGDEEQDESRHALGMKCCRRADGKGVR